MSTTCKYCNEPESKQYRPGLICENCISFVHLSCLRRQGTPGDFTCDVFFTYTCEDCSPEMEEVFARSRFPWVNVILLTLYHLNAQSYGISNHGYFHYKTHICSFIDRYWNVLFEPQFKQKKNWIGTIAGALSLYNNFFFRSGSVMLGETGWWKLMHAFSPAVASHILQEMIRDRPKSVPRSQMFLDKGYFIRKVTEMGYSELISDEKDGILTNIEPAMKKRRINSDEMSMTSSVSYDPFDSDSRNDNAEEVYNDSLMLMEEGSVSDAESNFRGFEYAPLHDVSPSESSSSYSQQQSTFYYDSDSGTATPSQTYNQSDSEEKIPELTKKTERDTEIVNPVIRETLFSSQLNSVDMPWLEKAPEPQSDLVEMTQYEEIQLLKQVEGLIPKMKDVNKKAYLCRFKAKLALRRLKRHKHLPLFDLDKSAKLLSGYVQEDTKEIQVERVLDRFQRSLLVTSTLIINTEDQALLLGEDDLELQYIHQQYLMDNLTGTIASTNYGTILLSTIEPVPFCSSYSSIILKPFIRRDFQTKPLWLKLMNELLVKTNKHVEDYEPPPTASIDYSYVRPYHIAALNNLCSQFFWPGIDLTESLQYPEFSCVVSYKKLVIGFAFLVPDVGPNEAYISFILTRPEWRNSKIATFMLYHLLQTCTDKDVTLHVSPTNPAVFLYQKFGFKVEELIQDFYEKYFDIDYKGCRHALFFRLVR